MPSGITADIYDGKDVTLRSYLMRVGRQMGFAILQRDEDMRSDVRLADPSTSYHDEGLADAQKRLAELDALTTEQAEEGARTHHEEAMERWAASRARRLALRGRYVAMIATVEAWEPDPLVAFVKEHALGHLRESLEFDVGTDTDEERWNPMPFHESGTDWLERERAKARRDIDYHMQHRQEDLDRAAERNRHIEAFLRSLPKAGE